MQMKLKPVVAAILLLAAGLTHAYDDNAVDADKDAAQAKATSSEVKVSGSGTVHINADSLTVTQNGKTQFFRMPDMAMQITSGLADAFSHAFVQPQERIVKGQPFSAEVINETVQNLPDGNQIVNKTSSLTYRDSAGRTRQEVRDAKGEVKLINIYDAVEGTRFIVTPGNKQVRKIITDKEIAERIEKARERAEASRERAEAARERAEQHRKRAEEHMREARERDGVKSVDVSRGPNGEEITTIRTERVGKDGKVEKREETVVRVVRVGDDADGQKRQITIQVPPAPPAPPAVPAPPAAPVPVPPPVPPVAAVGELIRIPAINNAFMDRQWRKNATTENIMGPRDFDGIQATGKRTTYTIPAGEVGNKKPIVVAHEVWTSPDLGVTVYARYSDPRSGESIYRLANVKRSEPPSNLFAAPEGYAVRESRVPPTLSRAEAKARAKVEAKAEGKAEAKAEAKAEK